MNLVKIGILFRDIFISCWVIFIFISEYTHLFHLKFFLKNKSFVFYFKFTAAIIKGNHTNCAQFANSNRLNWLFSRLGSQASSEGTGMLDVLHCVLIDSPEALNMMRVSLEKYFTIC